VATLVNDIGHRFFDKGDPFGLFSIFTKENHFVGHIDFTPADEEGTYEIGYILDERQQKKRYCTEAANALILGYIPELRKKGIVIRKVMATVHPDNSASKRILEKIGMVFVESRERFNRPRLWYRLDINPRQDK
jgi:RimJ/RimL family protein N-acetyltransferase